MTAEQVPARRRGRRTARPDPAAGPVGEFADRLWRLKREAGDPSYEEMAAKLGAAASKSSLAAAAQGRVLPSWEITWEFVRVLAVARLGRDASETEREWREHWQQARAVELEPSPGGPGQPLPVGPGQPLPGGPARSSPGEPLPVEPGRSTRRRLAVVLASVATAVTAALLAYLVLGFREEAQPEAGPVAEHDDSAFEGDITYPDGTVVPPNSSFTKTWRLRNTGTVVWANRFLARANEQPCTAPDLVAIPQTNPGQTVDISVPVETPAGPANCKIYWKMADEQGRTFFPAKRPIFLDVRVGGGPGQ